MKFSNSNGYYIFIFLFTITFIVVGIININNYNKIIQDKSEEAHGFSKNTVILFKWLTLGLVILCGIILFFNLFSFSFGIGFFEWMSPNASFLSKEVEGLDVADYLYRAGSPVAAKLKPIGSAAASVLGKPFAYVGGSLIGTGDIGNIDNLYDNEAMKEATTVKEAKEAAQRQQEEQRLQEELDRLNLQRQGNAGIPPPMNPRLAEYARQGNAGIPPPMNPRLAEYTNAGMSGIPPPMNPRLAEYTNAGMAGLPTPIYRQPEIIPQNMLSNINNQQYNPTIKFNIQQANNYARKVLSSNTSVKLTDVETYLYELGISDGPTRRNVANYCNKNFPGNPKNCLKHLYEGKINDIISMYYKPQGDNIQNINFLNDRTNEEISEIFSRKYVNQKLKEKAAENCNPNSTTNAKNERNNRIDQCINENKSNIECINETNYINKCSTERRSLM